MTPTPGRKARREAYHKVDDEGDCEDPAPAPEGKAFVWLWPPGAADPVLAGRITETTGQHDNTPVCTFTYDDSFLERPDAVSLFTPELPLRSGVFDPTQPEGPPSRDPLSIASCLRDASPDAWGRRVLNSQIAGKATAVLSELTYLLAAGSDRIGALDVTTTPSAYTPQAAEQATLDQLVQACELIEIGKPVPAELRKGIRHLTGVGGAQPKALLVNGERSLIAKFPSITQARPALHAEAVAMLLAQRVGINVASVEMVPVEGRDVLLVERFDRPKAGTRHMMVSALTLLGYGELASRHATYPQLADTVRASFTHPADTLRELYTRMVFNICVGNSDDHLRNHAAFWDGYLLELTPAYDIAPSPRAGGPLSHALGITRDGRRASQLHLARAAAHDFELDDAEAAALIDRVTTRVRVDYDDVCDQARVSAADRKAMWGREFLNPYVEYGEP
ncbi:type II toxin-antitoxin system HipA family toxin [Nocardioides halotolerans]|uniref:type II toxin-antitoxin system HipA family toxin n=1 Tax=Nocardioides halotolerans TaxID=433660 RepID=UPI000A02175A|nr:HipA domain-containing protein [Nocardioides halotolerans]